MAHLNRRQFLEGSLAAAGAVMAGVDRVRADIAPGVETRIAPQITGEERARQKDIWALEVNFKPVRMISVDVPGGKSGKTNRELVWYLAYRAVNRPESTTPGDSDRADERPIFVPEFTLATEDRNKQQIYPDRILPAALAAIVKRERYKYKNAVDIVGQLPPVTPPDARRWASLDGVAMWRGVDPDSDFFTVYMAGFSNGYIAMPGPDGKEVVQRRTIVQKFWRPSDRFDQNEQEIRLKDEPHWIYR
jgi:hypothetical protein